MIQERLIHPYKNYFEFPSRKVEFGSNPEDTVKLIANEELGIGISKIKFHGVNHKLDLKAEKDKVLSDRYFLIYSCESNTENFKPVFEDGYNHLMDLKAFKQKKLRHFDDTNILKIYKSESFLMDVSGFPIDF
jgi:8-oxo-dGTP pyrophosphatase MutT (NUDIX family)